MIVQRNSDDAEHLFLTLAHPKIAAGTRPTPFPFSSISACSAESAFLSASSIYRMDPVYCFDVDMEKSVLELTILSLLAATGCVAAWSLQVENFPMLFATLSLLAAIAALWRRQSSR